MKKLLIFAGILGLFLTLNFVFASSGNPFESILQAIFDLQNQIDNIELTPGPQGPSGPQGPAGPTLHLYDANNQDLGILLNSNDGLALQFTTYLPEKEIFLEMRQNYGNIFLFEATSIYYLEQNCNGLPYTNNLGNPHKALKAYANRIFKYTGEDIIVGQQPLSVLETTTGCQNSLPGAGALYPLEEITLPFSLPLAWLLKVKPL